MPQDKTAPSKSKASTAFKPPQSSKRGPKPKPRATATTTNRRRKSEPAHHYISSDDDEDDIDNDISDLIDNEDDDPASDTGQRLEDSDSNTSTLPDAPTTPTTDSTDLPPMIPPALLTKMLHHHFPDKNMRIGKDAMGVVGKYVETFVREAIARAAYERQEELEERKKRGQSRGFGDEFLEVSTRQHNMELIGVGE